MTRYDTPIGEVPTALFEPAETVLQRLEAETELPVELDDGWQIVGLASDLSRVELRGPDDEPSVAVDLPPQQAPAPEFDPAASTPRRRWPLPPLPLAPKARSETPWVELHIAGGKLACFMSQGDGKLVSLSDGRTLFTTTPTAEERASSPMEDFEELELARLRLSPDGRCLAAAGIDGVVGLLRPERGGPPILLPTSRGDGFAVRTLVFDRTGRRLAVEREAVYELGRLRLDLYHVELEDLMRLARGHAGRDIEATDLPAMLPVSLDDLGGPAPMDEEETKLYLAAIGAADIT